MALMQPILNQRLTRVIALWLILGTVSAAAEAADELVFANGFEFDGEFDFVMPYLGPPTPAEGRLESNGTFKSVDLYLLEDVSGSMGTEITSVSAGFTGFRIQSVVPGFDAVVGKYNLSGSSRKFVYFPQVIVQLRIVYRLTGQESRNCCNKSIHRLYPCIFMAV